MNAALPRAGVAERLARLPVTFGVVPVAVAIMGLGAVPREDAAKDGEWVRRLVRERIFDNLGLRGGGVGGKDGTGIRVIESARERVRLGEGGAKGDEGTRWWRRLGDPEVFPRFGEFGAERGDARLGETGTQRAW